MTENIRMLAAIMFADMAGYTALMQENEVKARSNREKYRTIIEDKISQFQGRILQYYGDGTLVIFGSAISAINCAVDIQQELQKDPKIPVRIGLHIGDIVYDDDGVFGDAVNVASRIESLSIEGSVLITEKMYDEIKNQPALPAKHIGAFELKNIKQPVNVYAMVNDGLAVPVASELHGKAKNAYRSVAVLPFINMSADPENEFFSDGMTEEIINALTKVDGLHVTARTSSFAFKGKSDDIRAIGQKLNVSTILEGSVRKSGNTVRITAQLINAIDGYHFWSESYDCNLDNIFGLQDEISRKIANKLIEQLAVGKVTSPLVKTPVTDINAYNHYLKGLFYWNKWNPQDNAKAIAEFQQAIEIETKFAKAYAWLSICYMMAGAMGFQKSEKVYPLFKQNAIKAMALDPDSPDCNVAMGLVYLFVDWNWEEAGIAFKKAIALNPGVGSAHQTYSLYLMAVGKYKESLEAIEKAAHLDPLSLPIASQLASCYLSNGRIDDTIEQVNKILDMDPVFRNALELKGWAYFLKGELETAVSLLKEYQKISGGEQKALTGLAYVYSQCGCSDKTFELLKRLEQREIDEPETSFTIDYAFIYTGLKDFDKAFYYLNKAVEERSGAVIFMRNSPIFANLRDDPRFIEIMKKVGFKD